GRRFLTIAHPAFPLSSAGRGDGKETTADAGRDFHRAAVQTLKGGTFGGVPPFTGLGVSSQSFSG
ncbi:MAG TPA: hypothetical protein VNU01_11870, partial [Egibacteraceae bacterium]|nr:hypothetical protein [Egibacteraceae bacterium]